MFFSILPVLVTVVVYASSVRSSVLPREDTIHEIVRFSTDHQAENLAVRPNGQILVTISGPTAAIYQIDPFCQNKSVLVESFPFTSALGITELFPDVFYFVLANVSLAPLGGIPGTSFIYKLDMTRFATSPQGAIIHPPSIQKVASVPDAGFLNGLTSFTSSLGRFILAADSIAAQVWKINVASGAVSVAIKDPSMVAPPDAELPLGVNGIKVHSGSLYYTNTGSESLYRIPLSQNGSAAGSAHLIASSVPCDDLILDKVGNVYLATGTLNVVLKVSNTGVVTTIAGTSGSASSLLISPTAIQFGKTKADSSSIYVTTSGGAFSPAIGTQGLSRVDIGAHA